MKKYTLPIWIVVLALVLTACTMSASNKPLASPTVGIKPTGIGTAIALAQAATATSVNIVVTETPITKEITPAPTEKATEVTKSTQVEVIKTPIPTVPGTPPIPLNVLSGENFTTIQGEMNAGDTNHYVIKAEAGQMLSVTVWSPNGDVYLTIVDGDGKEIVDASTKANRWSGEVSINQDMILSVTATGGTTSFSMDVVVNSINETQTLEPTQIAQATSTPKPTSLPVVTGPFDPTLSYGPPSMNDPMNGNNLTDWMATDGKLPDTDNIKLTMENGKFYITGKKAGWATWWFSPISLKNIYMEITVETDVCTGKDSYGMILRGPEHGAGKSFGYIFSFSCDGAYQVIRLDSISPYSVVTLAGWTNNQYISSGSFQKNVMGIKMDGNMLTLYANGNQLVELSDSVYPSGRYGLYVSPDASIDFTYRVVQMRYWLLGVKK